MEPLDVALLLLRGWVGVVMIAHGVNHGRSLDGTTRWFERIGFRSAAAQARLSMVGEVAIGVLLVIGLGTAFAALGVVAVMTVAFVTVHRFIGFFVFRKGEGVEYVTTLAVAALLLGAAGPGSVSVDELAGITVSGWAGGGLALAGVAAALGQVLVFWRKPVAP